MNKDDLIKTITAKVFEKLNVPGNCDCGGGVCNCQGVTPGLTSEFNAGAVCPPAWDGVGDPVDMIRAGAQRLSSMPPVGTCPDPTLARMIDHTLLKPDVTEADIRKLCAEAQANCFMSVCVNPCWVSLAAKLLRRTNVKVCTVVGFPLGATFARAKELETRIAIDEGASEIDMVLNIGALRSGDLKTVEADMRAVRRAVRGSVISKVILETCLLSDEEIVAACKIAARVGFDFVKTSTGFSTKGATLEHVQLMRKTVGKELGVKASGGIRDHETALNMLGAGASRIGASASVAIVDCEVSGKKQGY